MGSNTPSVTLEDVLAVFEQQDRPRAPLTAPEVADLVDCARRTAHQKLTTLSEQGELATKKVGARGRIWWRTEPAQSGDRTTTVDTGHPAMERERALRQLHDASRRLMHAETCGDVCDIAVEAAHRILGLSLSGLWMYDPERAVLEPMAWTEPGVERYGVPPDFPIDGSLAGEVFRAGTYRVYDDISSEQNLLNPETDVRSELILPLGGHGVLNASSPAVAQFDDVDVSLARVLAANVEAALDRTEQLQQRRARLRKIDRQREQLEALNYVNDVVRGIAEAVIEQSTRNEIEQVVCDRLANSESYRFAWICAVDSSTQSVEPRAEAGVDGYLEEIPLSTDPDVPAGQGPTGKAMLTRELQIARNVRDDPDFELWHEYAREYGYRSSAAIPIVHEETLYGVIGLYSERPDAFEEDEREIVDQLGEIVGHAIAAVERKRALLSDEVVELAFRMYDVEKLALPESNSGRVVFDRILPLGDGTFLEYGVATGDAMEIVRAMVDSERTPHSEPVHVLESSDDEIRFELRLVEPSFLPTVVDSGGYVHDARVEDGQYTIRVHLPPTADVRHIVDTVTETFPEAEMVMRQQRTRSDLSPRRIMQLLSERLTDRQRAALEAGYFGGFYEWPRDRSGEEVAASLGIGAPTFHQHVRKAEKKLLDVIFEEP